MKINFKQPKYVLPVIALPFLCLIFYAWRSGFSNKKPPTTLVTGLNGNVGNVSAEVRKRDLAGKLDAYRNTYKETDGITAVNVIPKEASSNATFHSTYNARERQALDSIDKAMKAKYNKLPSNNHDQALASAISGVNRRQHNAFPNSATALESERKDPMEMFKLQMAYMDSVNKENDPAFKAEKLKKLAAEKSASLKAKEITFSVTKDNGLSPDFNTVVPQAANNFITASIDQNITGLCRFAPAAETAVRH